jgi:hypothetical protein
MNNQTYNQLTIEGDPTTWVLAGWINESELQQSGAPFVAEIISPRAGTLLVSCRAVASVLLGAQSDPGGPIWTDDSPMARSWLYLPTDTGLTPNSRGYALAANTNLGDLENDIRHAMTTGTFATIPLSVGTVSLNGATLPFAMILPQ